MDIERGDERQEINWVEEDISVWSVEELQYAGCLVVIFTPDELKDTNVSHMEERMIEFGWDFIG